jgi:putative oxidoreductase
MVHFRDAWWPIHNRGELAVIYCFLFLYFAAAGGGPLSLDHCFWKRCADETDDEAVAH